MKLIELVEQLLTLASEDDEMLRAHVEVLGHDGSWSWVSEASELTLHDAEGPTKTVVLHVSNEGVRQLTEPIGRPASSYPVNHNHPHQEEE